MNTKHATIDKIEVNKIETNPDNPRGKNIRDTDKRFEYLKRSIKQHGLLVPLVVYKLNKDGVEKYRLLDGERRYYALKELGIRSAPAHIFHTEKAVNEAKNIMFHIHTNREQWGGLEQCNALEEIYKKLKKEHNNNEKEIIKKLIQFTGAHPWTIKDRVRFLRWPRDIKNSIYNKISDLDLYRVVVEIEGGIIEPAKENFPDYFRKVPVNQVRRLLLDKYIKNYVAKGTEVRKVKSIVSTNKDKPYQYNEAKKILNKLITERSYTFEDAREDFLTKYPNAEIESQLSPKKIIKLIIKLNTYLKYYDLSTFNTGPKKLKNEFLSVLDELGEIIIDTKSEM